MTHAEVHELLLQGKPLNAEARAHLNTCPACKALVEADFSVKEALTSDAVEHYKLIATSQLRPVRPAASDRQFTLLLLALFLCFTLCASLASGWQGFEALHLGQKLLYYGVIVAAALFAASGVVQEIRPGARRYLDTKMVVVIGSAALLAVVGGLFPNLNASRFVRYGEGCLELGSECALASAILFAIVLRQGFVLSPIRTGIITGFLSGLVGVAVLSLYCSLLTIPHIWVWHFGVLPLGVGLGAAIGGLIQKRSQLRNFSDRRVETQ